MRDREQTSIKSIQRCYFNMICNKAYYIMLDIVFEHLEILVVTQMDYNKRLIRARIGVGKKINPSPVSYINFGTKQKTHLQSAIFFKLTLTLSSTIYLSSYPFSIKYVLLSIADHSSFHHKNQQ